MSADRTNGPCMQEPAFRCSPLLPRRLPLLQVGQFVHLSKQPGDILVGLVERAATTPGAETLERPHRQERAIIEARQALIAELERRCRAAAAAA